MTLFRRTKARALERTFLTEGIRFNWPARREVTFPLATNSTEVLTELMADGASWAALQELWEDGFVANVAPNVWNLSYDIFERLSGEDQQILKNLGLPVSERLDLEIVTRGSVADPSFRILVEIHHPIHGIIREGDYERIGPAFVINRAALLPLTREQRLLFDAAAGSDVNWNSLEGRMVYLARVKTTARAAGARLDRYLQTESYEFVSEVQLDLREDSPDEITLIPHVEGIEAYTSGGGEDLLRGEPPVVLNRFGAGLRRKRMVFDQRLREKLSELPPKGKVTGADVPRLLTNPDQIIPEGFDLSLFSERVKGIRTRVYNSRPYIHIRRSTGGWFEGIPGIELEDWSPGEAVGLVSGDSSDPMADAPGGLSLDTYREIVRRARESGDEYVRCGDSWVRVDPETAEKFDTAVETLERQQDNTYRIPAGSMLDVYDNLELLEFIDTASSARLETDLIPDDLTPETPPTQLNGRLHPHQLVGYQWLTRLYDHRIGGLLADDMGLGKTVQVIAHLMRLKEKGVMGPHLIVVPKTLMANWEREIDNFSNRQLSVYAHDGPDRHFDPCFLAFYDVVLTTYDTLRRDQTKLATVNWNLVVCDEAQYAKNPTAQRTSAVKALKSKHRTALTGTPVENGLIEFWCIMDFVQPGLLGSWSRFRATYEKPIIESEEAKRDSHVQKLMGEIRGHYLRRMKSDILKDLPPKNIHYRFAGFGREQYEIYREIAREGKAGGKGAALGAIQRLLIVSAHPMAVGSNIIRNGAELDEVSPKLDETLSIVAEVQAASEKVLIFTDFKKVQRILQAAIRSRFGIWPDIINGDLTKNRQIVIDVFSNKPGFNALILGHQVGGVGLNITSANHVIHYTRPWNPAKENQATDRVHRIGQSKLVNVYYPILRDDRFVTVEERLDEVIRSKADLAQEVLCPSAQYQVRQEDLFDCLTATDEISSSWEDSSN